MCADCGRKTSVTAGTIFEGTRTPLSSWFAAAWFVTSQKQGLSALGLQSALGLGSYQTAWMMLHRFRVAMVRPDRERLTGRVEVDESYVGGHEDWARGRQTETKSRVAIAVEMLDPKGFGRIRLQRIPDVSKASLIGFVKAAVEPGARVCTDEWRSYLTLPDHGYPHERIAAVGHHDPFVGVAVIGQREIGAPSVGADPRPRLHSCLHEHDQARLRDIRDALQSDAPKALRVEHLDGDRDPRFRLGLPAPGPVLMPADVALVDFDAAGESFAIGADHRDAEAVQHHPCGLVAAKPQRALKPERAEPLLLAGHKPGRREPRTQRRPRALEDRAGRH